MLAFEIGFLGLKFSLLRALFSLPVFVGIGFLLALDLKNKEFRGQGTWVTSWKRKAVLMPDLDIDRLAKLYVEPTNRCNLDCRTCMRHGWEEELGFMEFELFEKISEGLAFFA